MSRNGTLLPIPDDPRFEWFQRSWPEMWRGYGWPRSAWLGSYEILLSEFYPQSSSADRKLTARHYAPFPLRDGHDVP